EFLLFFFHCKDKEGLGEASFLSISFLLTFQSTPFCVVKDALLQCKRASFAMQLILENEEKSKFAQTD
ncbi:hypothetical protein, partial [Prevotella histicola]|uniref:hypothetical protein n=1 Tax=Prevotella histicola TaxID=470565 RepID=UPI0028EB3FDF